MRSRHAAPPRWAGEWRIRGRGSPLRPLGVRGAGGRGALRTRGSLYSRGALAGRHRRRRRDGRQTRGGAGVADARGAGGRSSRGGRGGRERGRLCGVRGGAVVRGAQAGAVLGGRAREAPGDQADAGGQPQEGEGRRRAKDFTSSRRSAGSLPSNQSATAPARAVACPASSVASPGSTCSPRERRSRSSLRERRAALKRDTCSDAWVPSVPRASRTRVSPCSTASSVTLSASSLAVPATDAAADCASPATSWDADFARSVVLESVMMLLRRSVVVGRLGAVRGGDGAASTAECHRSAAAECLRGSAAPLGTTDARGSQESSPPKSSRGSGGCLTARIRRDGLHVRRASGSFEPGQRCVASCAARTVGCPHYRCPQTGSALMRRFPDPPRVSATGDEPGPGR